MSKSTIELNQHLYNYLLSVSLNESKVLRDLRKTTSTLPNSRMQIAPDQGQFMALLLKIMGAKNLIEVGTYTGYSTLVCAQALEEGKIITIDRDEVSTKVAKKYWRDAKIQHLIDLKIGDAREILEAMQDDLSIKGCIDFVFIDADKSNYLNYYELTLNLLRKNGIILFDNVLWDGAVADDSFQDEDTIALRKLNEFLLQDDRVEISMIAIGDGLTIVRKKTL
ncbi:MAG: class I SAM-dependent methyltransferase [Gammaproteobacteria bacterium]|nr:class I SAM-dependent methyltransferase [Gammaproteobacteria bacterium]